jgi:hypothetical protein
VDNCTHISVLHGLYSASTKGKTVKIDPRIGHLEKRLE